MTAVAVSSTGPARPVRWGARAGVLGAAVVGGLSAAGCILLIGNVVAGAPAEDGPGFWPMQVVAALAYGTVGSLLVARRTAGPIGPLFLLVAFSQAAALFGREYGVRGLQVVDGLPGDRWMFWVHTWIWVPGLLSLLLVVPLLLPDGRLPSARWRPAVALGAVAAAVATLGWALSPYDRLDGPSLDGTIGPNPVGAPAAAVDLIDLASGPLLAAGAALAVSAVVVRRHRAGSGQRRAIAWVLYGVVLSVVLQGLVIVFDLVVLSAPAVAVLPVCCLIAVTRHRMWDLQLVVRRSLLYGGLTAVVAMAYAGVAGLVGGAVGASTGAPVVATAVVAMLVMPAHQLLRRLVNTIVHGRAEDPYVTVTRLGLRLGSAVSPEQVTSSVLPEVLTEVARALPLRHLSLVTTDGQVYPPGTPPPAAAADTVALPLRHSGRLVGTVHLAAARGGLTRSERRALEHFATQAAVAVHSVVLTAELRRERERVVVAREEERRRLRRELHDGVGTALAAARLQAGAARALMAQDPEEGLAVLGSLEDQLRDAVLDVRAVTRELRPALLDELGLAGALREFGARCTSPEQPVAVEVGELGEVPAAVEVAAYLVVAELVTNACRHALASRVSVRVVRSGADLRIRVADDGRGFGPDAPSGVGLRSVRHRVEEVGGELRYRPGAGTVVEARLPLGSR